MKVEYFPTKNWYISKRNMELFEDRVQPCHWKVFKKGCQHPSHKFEIFWQVAQNLISLLLPYFLAQYVLIIMV